MTQVSTQRELQNALSAKDDLIQIAAGFSIASQISITYEVTIESLTPDNIFTLTKDASYSSYLFRISGGGSLTFQNIIIDGDKSAHDEGNTSNRSLVYVTGGSLHLAAGSILQNNNSASQGGAVNLTSSTSTPNTLLMDGTAQILGCYSVSNGGGIMINSVNPQDSCTVTGQALIKGSTAVNGGGIFCRSYAEGVPSLLSIDGKAHIANNKASGTGGGICFSGFRNGGTVSSILTLSGSCLISENQAGSGGGIYYYASNAGDRLNITENSSVAKNTALQSGGGIFMTIPLGSGTLDIRSASVSGNSGGTGGGVYLLANTDASVTVTGAKLENNSAVNERSGSGGGLWIQNQSGQAMTDVSFNNVQLVKNQASAAGGGIYLAGGSGTLHFKADETTVRGNLASDSGGGLLVSSSGTAALDFHRSTVNGNTADTYGGGMYYANLSEDTSAHIVMTGTTVSENSAGQEGGGLRIGSSAGTLDTVLTDCIISANTALKNSGGGIWNGGSHDTLTLAGSTSVTQNRTQMGNGGGIYFNSDSGSLFLTGQTKITYNRADETSSTFGNHGGGICAVPGRLTIQDDTEIAYNSALGYGGGVSAAEKTSVSMTGGSIHDNRSSEYGGGVWNHGGSIFSLAGGSVYQNQAEYGGGFYTDLSGTLLLSSGSVYANHAAAGGGIYNASSSSTAISDSCLIGTVNPNTASSYGQDIYNEGSLNVQGDRKISNGVYLDNRSAVVRIQAILTPGSVIQLENSGYVAPNTQNVPIVIGEATASYPLLTKEDADAFRKPPAGFGGWEIRLSEDSTQVLLAPVNYAIRYENLMGAQNTNPVFYTVNTPDIHLSAPGPVSGYRFLGWFDASSGGSRITVISQGSTGDLTLYARWEAVSFYTATYHGNESCRPVAHCIPWPVTVEEGSSFLISRQRPVRKGYRFLGWNTDPCGSGISYLPGMPVPGIHADLNLYAIWKKCCSFCL
ncbi:InlB B-repeat-containing protein [Anaerostipes sp.]|uniref:InlB B-repeat-containing protein n=1 Tax=Anaerostipes sp. TaxID=1872530 RepID=UPI0025B9C514|nr:InlB B-repeat-containing protein [Anaerostipes sp.]MBS7009691.1 InlB B-repeat-containing protein [Anaerostipes sp.]